MQLMWVATLSVFAVFPQFVIGQDGVFRLKNQGTGEYLFAASDDYARDSDRRNVFCWKKTNENVSDWADWKIVPVESEFTIQSVANNEEFLYAAADNLSYDDERRSVFTWRNKAADTAGHYYANRYWKLIKNSKACKSCYQIRNIGRSSEFLYAASEKYDYDKERTRVFTWIPDTEDYTGRSIWQLISV